MNTNVTSPGIEALRTFRRRITKFAVISVLLAAAVFGFMHAVDDFNAAVQASQVEKHA